MDVSKKFTFVQFCSATAYMLKEDLGIPFENLICLIIECIEMAKHFFPFAIMNDFVRFCYASASMLQEDLGLPTEKLICLYKECTEMAKHCHDKRAMVQSCWRFVVHSNSKGRLDDSLRCLKEILPLAVEIPECELIVHQCLSLTYKVLNEFDNFVLHAKKWIEIARKIGDKENEMKGCREMEKTCITTFVWFCLASALQEDLGLPTEKLICLFKECMEMAKHCDDERTTVASFVLFVEHSKKKAGARECLCLGWIYQTLEQHNDAVFYGNKCIEIAKKTGEKEIEMKGHLLLAQVYLDLTQVDDVSLSVGAGMAIATELGDKEMKESFEAIHFSLYAVAGLFDNVFELPSAKEFLEVPTCSEDVLLQDLDQAVKTGDKIKIMKDSMRLFIFYCSRQEHEKAIRCIKQLKEMDVFPFVRLYCVVLMGREYQEIKQYDKALQCYEEGLPIAESCAYDVLMRSQFYYGYGNVLSILNTELNLAERYLREAIRCFEAIFTTLGSRDEFKISIFDYYFYSYKRLAILLIKGEQIEEALLVLDRCRARALKDLMISNYKMEREGCNDERLKYSDVLSLVSRNDFNISYYSVFFDEVFLKFFLGGETGLEFSFHLNASGVNDVLRTYVDTLFHEMDVRGVDNCEDRPLDNEEDIQKEQTRCIEDHEELNQATVSLLNCDSKGKEPNENNAETNGSILGALFRFFVFLLNLFFQPNLDSKEGESSEKSADTKGSLEVLFQILECDRILSSKQDEVVIIPEGPLFQVPFPALRDPRTGKYLSGTKRVRLAPSLATLKYFVDFPADQTSNAPPLIIGDPFVGKVMMDGEERTDIEPLSGARQEAETISKVLNTPALLKEQATKLAVIKRLQEGASVVHIAAHGILSKATILLAPSPEIRATKIPDEEDYMLTMADVQQAKVRAQLVVLSCCHSGRGKIRAEGVVGMCRAFLVSGARAVVASLWAIDDEATLAFMKLFYVHLKNGKSASTSLQLTMNEMRNSTDYKEPKYWAPFFLMGDDVTLQL